MEADTESRIFNTSTVWSQLHPQVFAHIHEMWGPFHIYLFVSRLNFKVPTYVSSHAGLKITAGHRTMSGQDDYLSGQNLGLAVILTGQVRGFQIIH